MFGLKLSRVRKPASSQFGAEDFLELLEPVKVQVEENLGNLRELTTAIQRIERKQNRWLDLLNLKSSDLDKAGSKDQGPEDAGLLSTTGPGGDGGIEPTSGLLAGEPEGI